MELLLRLVQVFLHKLNSTLFDQNSENLLKRVIYRRWFFYLTVSILFAEGCAVDDIGFVKVMHFENETMYMVSKESWGVYLSTENVDAGLMFGHMDRTFLYPKTRKLKELELNNLLSNLEQDQFIETTDDKLVKPNSEGPVAWITNNQGLMFHANQLKFGLTIGLESRDVIRLPNDFKGLFIINYNSKGKIHANFRQQSPNTKR
jgi:hypothetical protein